MSDYLIVANVRAARDRSRQIALDYGCGPITTHWFDWRVHPTDGRAAMVVVSETEDAVHSRGRERLASAERTALQSNLTADWETEEQRTR